ncbi:uncharacterized protein MELLADRAFT_113681 [Melampsora larici-populina 98AG31]|uniref:Uncharacterized protein n=1 Tax=Melampsora larici-populina (strain 98AG31 / pathotype 3-4-7) TaxID=747676 RepID=F4SAR0_MELLP|nr:uncharacterized protein MELLADRAFT_113681 [Melampsora larici-populina 98AG31]EGF98275.1 hypothetical protein MELLADRAFT_113681 [Melampsora larici-populina 98AG31]
MVNAESRAIRANRRANGNNTQSTSTGANASSIDGEDLPPDGETDVGEDSDSNGRPRDQPLTNSAVNGQQTGNTQSHADPNNALHRAKKKKAAKQKKSKSKKTSKGKEKTKKSKNKRGKNKKDKKKSSKKSKSKGVIEIDIGSVPTGDLVPLQPYWGDQMSDLNTSIPLTVFDQNFARADKDEHNRNHHSSSSKNKTNKGFDAPSQYRLTFGEWSENMSLFRRYLSGYYNQKPLAKRLKLHIKNVKAIKRSTECWMTALRYDILCRAQIFVKREGKTRMKDIGSRVLQYENQAKDKSLRAGKANCGDINPYARGGRFENRNPETGLYENTTHQQSSGTGGHAGSNPESQSLKRKRGRRGGHNTTQQPTSRQAPSQNAPRPVQHVLPPNPTLYPNQHPLPPPAPMAANRFPNRGGRGGWRGGRGGFHNPRNNT